AATGASAAKGEEELPTCPRLNGLDGGASWVGQGFKLHPRDEMGDGDRVGERHTTTAVVGGPPVAGSTSGSEGSSASTSVASETLSQPRFGMARHRLNRKA
ncbi:unnamed protein product, partial [Effrenium voratum]